MSDQMSPSVTWRRGIAFLALIGAVIVAIGLFVLTQRGEATVNIASEVPKPIPVMVSTVSFSETLAIDERFSGLASAGRTSSLGFETGGRVDSIYADIGDNVKKGALLARTDTRSLRARLSAAEAQISEAQASLKLAAATVERQQTLTERGLLSGQRFDEAEAQQDAARARLALAEAQADQLKVQIDLAEIRAPFSGIITQRMVDEGTIASPGLPLLTLVESGKVEARVGLPETVAANLKVGDAYRLETVKGDVQAQLRSKTGIVDATSRTVTAIFDFSADAQIPPGSVIRLRNERRLEQRGFWIPVSALTEAKRGLWAMYVVVGAENGDVIEKRLVDIVHADAERVFARGAVQDGEAFVVSGLQRLTPGQLVSAQSKEA